MAESRDEHASLIKTPRQLIVVVVLAFVIPVALIVIVTQLVTSGTAVSPDNPALSEEAIAQRIKPHGTVVVDPSQPKPEPAAAAVASAPVPIPAAPSPGAESKPAAAEGKSVYDSACMACHAAGVAGAPKAGDKAAWAPRLNAGMETLYTSAIKGKNAMPPKGGNLSLSDAQVKAAVDYLVGLVK